MMPNTSKNSKSKLHLLEYMLYINRYFNRSEVMLTVRNWKRIAKAMRDILHNAMSHLE